MLKPAKAIIHFTVLLLLIGICSGCAAPQATTGYKEPLVDQGELYFYLQPLPQEMLPLSFTISEITVIPEQGNVIPILTSRLEIRGRELIGRQKRLVAVTLPPGRYRGVYISIEQAGIATEEGVTDILPPPEPIRVDLNFSILRGRSQALFLDLSPEFLVSRDRFTPRFALGNPYLPPQNYMGFISHASENIVTVFNKRTMEVIQVIHTGTGPQGMALDQLNGIVYVANAGEDTIELISVTSMAIIGTIKLSLGDEPIELALTPDGRTLLSVNRGSDSISIIDTRSMSERERLILDPDPEWVVAGKDGKRAYVLHTLSNTISIIDLDRRSLYASVSLDESPLRGALNRDGENFYIISQYASELLVVDTQSFGVTDRVIVGNRSSAVKVNPKNNLIYVAKTSGEVVIADPTTGLFIDSFPVVRNVGFLAIDGEENTLYVLSPDSSEVTKFNLVNNRELAKMETEMGGHSLVVMGEL
ncbi:MAG: YncE family protein [Desulfobulbaceae bacterium]|nr:YncE family protein [Desulfobulbaceae bacterium]